MSTTTGEIKSKSLDDMLDELSDRTQEDIRAMEQSFASFIRASEAEIAQNAAHDALVELHQELSEEAIAGTIRALEPWSDGTTNFRIVTKSWPSLIDKLYRLNIENNRSESLPPLLPTITELLDRNDAGSTQRWVTPAYASMFTDDLLRTKLVVPFADGVVDVTRRLEARLNTVGVRRYRRYHAKDTGYHAHHHYLLIDVPGYLDPSKSTPIALEVKILTKVQDILGELTHRLYELHRTGQLPETKKRKYAWDLGSPDFLASYLGHSAHLLEASICNLKDALQLEDDPNG